MSKRLERLIAQGEHQQQDFKFAINDSRKIAKSLVAFANTDGGRLLIGVKDNGVVAGISTDEEYYMIEAAAQLYCKPQINFTFERHESRNQKTVLEIIIARSDERPHFAQDDHGNWIAYQRIDDQNIAADQVQIKVWKQSRSPKGSFIQYSNAERILFDYLTEHQQISLRKFATIAKIPSITAEQILVKLVVSEVLRMDFVRERVVYLFKPKMPKND
jgi:predicted HTH transcriptional regulator